MNKTKDTGYLFAKMSPVDDNGIGHVIVGDERDKKIPSTRTYNFDENASRGERQSLKKWIAENKMLLVTLIGVLVGIVTGANLD